MTPEEKRVRDAQLVFASQAVAAAQGRKLWGKVIIILEGGVLRRVITEGSDIPPFADAPAVASPR
jgi:hypothetical protein